MEQQHFQEGMAAFSAPLHVAVLVGCGAKIAKPNRMESVHLLKQRKVQAVYVSDDDRSTDQKVMDEGVPAG